MLHFVARRFARSRNKEVPEVQNQFSASLLFATDIFDHRLPTKRWGRTKGILHPHAKNLLPTLIMRRTMGRKAEMNRMILETGLRLLFSARADEKYTGREMSDWVL